MNRTLAICTLLAVLAQPGHARVLSGADGITWPETMRLIVVADNMRVNGIDTRIYAFESPDSADRIAEHFQHEWRGRMKRAQAPPWDVLSHRDGSLLVTVQIKADVSVGTRGFVSFSNAFDILDGRVARVPPDIPLPPKTTVHQVIDANDADVKSRTVVLLSELPPEQPLDFYRDYYRSQGFAPVSGESLRRGESGGVMVLNRGATQANVAVAARGGQTVVTIVTVNP